MTNREAAETMKRISEKLSRVIPLNDTAAEAFRMAIEALEKDQWIPCSERLPEDGTWNIFTDGKSISVERYKADAIDHFFPEGRWFELEDVIAWRPLPKPYRKEGEEE